MVHWDGDERKDLLIGRSDGLVMIFLNVGTDADPQFDRGAHLQVGPPGSKSNIDVGSRATPTTVDWDGDGRKDLVVGALDGKVRLFLNEGMDSAPDFVAEHLVQEAGADLVVPSVRSSPEIVDLTHDGRKDILTGNTEGQLLLYENIGGGGAPVFSGYVHVESDGFPIDLPSSPRSRPFLGHWTEVGVPDVLIGAADGLVRVYLGSDVLTGAPPTDSFPLAVGPRLLAAYPNPFRPGTTVSFALGSGGRVRVLIYDAAGRRVATLTDRVLGEGAHERFWDGKGDDGRPVSAGIYFVRMETGGTVASSKLVRLR